MGALFPRDRLNQFALEAGFWGQRSRAALGTLARLLSRRADGTLQALSETRAEQSFNERLFAELFGYQTLLRSGQGSYHLLPKHWHAAGRYDDFCLGFFSPSDGTPLVSGELKSPGTDLDAPQPVYGSITPVQQAMRAVSETPSVRWVLLSNFDEIRLYRAGDEQQFHSIRLSELLTPWDMEKALAVFSRETLLGTGDKLPPIEKLFCGKVPKMLNPRDGSIRLIHLLRPAEPLTTELRLHVLHDALVAGCTAHWRPELSDLSPQLEEDRLVARRSEKGGVFLLIELATSGVLTVSEYLGNAPSGARRYVEASDVAFRIARFLGTAQEVTPILKTNSKFQATWSLLDATDSTCSVSSEWSNPKGLFQFVITKGVDATRVPPTVFAPQEPVLMTVEAVREILYPYEGRLPSVSTIARICPSAPQIDAVLKDHSLVLKLSR